MRNTAIIVPQTEMKTLMLKVTEALGKAGLCYSLLNWVGMQELSPSILACCLTISVWLRLFESFSLLPPNSDPCSFCIIFSWVLIKTFDGSFQIWISIHIYSPPQKLLLKPNNLGAPGWLSWLNVQLPLRSWSCSSWVQAPCWALCWQIRPWSLLWIMCLLLSLPLLSPSLKNK